MFVFSLQPRFVTNEMRNEKKKKKSATVIIVIVALLKMLGTVLFAALAFQPNFRSEIKLTESHVHLHDALDCGLAQRMWMFIKVYCIQKCILLSFARFTFFFSTVRVRAYRAHSFAHTLQCHELCSQREAHFFEILLFVYCLAHRKKKVIPFQKRNEIN